MAKLNPPVARCTACGEVWHDLQIINREHHCQGRKKPGLWSSTLAPGDWAECTDCAATGEAAKSKCTACDGIGWHFTRKGP